MKKLILLLALLGLVWAQPTPTVSSGRPELPVMPGRPLRSLKAQPPGEVPGDTALGFKMPASAGSHTYTGATFYMSPRLTFSITGTGNPPRNVTMYAPTVMVGGNACLEVSMAHWRTPSSPTYHGLGFWDWCGTGAGGDGTGGWQNFYYFDVPGFSANYVTNMLWTVEGDSYYDDTIYVKVAKVAGTNCWRGYLWKWSTGVWDQKSQSCGTSAAGTIGWNMFEVYGYHTPVNPPCFSFYPGQDGRVIQMRGLYLIHSTGVDPVTPASIPGYLTFGNYCTDSDVWHYYQGNDFQGGPNISFYWAVTSGL